MSEDKEIKREITKLKTIFKDIPEDKKDMVEGLIENAAFMRVTLRDLQQEIADNGTLVTYVGGFGKEVTKENPAHKAYTSMVGKYAGVIEQLNKMLPSTRASEVAKAGDLLKEFIKAGKPE